MKKTLTLIGLVSTLFLSGCGSTTTQQPTNTNTDNKKNIARSIVEPTPYDIIKSDKYPVCEKAYSEKNTHISSYHSDNQEEISNFENEYKELTGEKYESAFDGTMIVAKAGVKNSSNYTMRVEEVNDSGRYTNIHIAVIKSEGCPASEVLTSPYIITLIPNHKEVKYTIEEKVIECK